MTSDDVGSDTDEMPMTICPSCAGSGRATEEQMALVRMDACVVCEGQGLVPEATSECWLDKASERDVVRVPCPACSSQESPSGCTYCLAVGLVTPARDSAWRERPTVPVPACKESEP